MFSRVSRAFNPSKFIAIRHSSTITVSKIVDDISTLNLLQTADLVSQLKIRLNIADVAVGVQSAAPIIAAVEAIAEPAAAAQTSFKVTLQAFDPSTKAKIIKEIKGILPGANLVEAKKFVEGAPKMIRDGVSKEEAEKLKATLEAVGATILLE